MFNFLKKKKRVLTVKQFQDVGLLGSLHSGQRVTEQKALQLPAVYACIRVISEAAAALPLVLYKRNSNGAKQRARTHPLYNLVHNQPNPYMDPFTVFELLIAGCLLRGNAYAHIERNNDGFVTALYPLLPSQMRVKVEKNRILYEYTQAEQKQIFKMQDILHLKGLSWDGIIGLSPLSLLSDTIGRALAINEYTSKYFENDAKPGGVLSHPATLGETAWQNLKKAWNTAYKGVGNSHKIAVLEEGMKFEKIGLSPEESQMIDSCKFSVVEIARAFKVPLNLIQDHERSTYSNVTEQNRAFVVHTLAPWLIRLEQACNRSLLTEKEKKRYFFEHKIDSLLKGDQKTRYECYSIGLDKGFLSKNDVRGFENLTLVPGGDKYQTVAEQKNARSIPAEPVKRDQIISNFKPLIKATVKGIVNQECASLRSLIGKESRSAEDKLKTFYASFPKTLKKQYEPVLKAFADAIKNESELEMQVTSTDLKKFIQDHIQSVADDHALSSLNQLLKLLEDKDMTAVETRMDEWMKNDNRANKVSENESISTSNKIFAAVAFYHGFKIRVQARGGACAFCQRVSGTILGSGDVAVTPGNYSENDMVVKTSMSEPPWHRGCSCYLIKN